MARIGGPKTRTTIPIPQQLIDSVEYRDGKLFWIVPPSFNQGHRVGKEAGGDTTNGYRQIKFKDVHYKTHRVIWKLLTGKEPGPMLDHINRDKLDNRIENLREVTNSQNQLNNKAKRLFYNRNKNLWVVSVIVENKQKQKYFKNFCDALRAREAFLKSMLGEYYNG